VTTAFIRLSTSEAILQACHLAHHRGYPTVHADHDRRAARPEVIDGALLFVTNGTRPM
jgi:hypothetical protein